MSLEHHEKAAAAPAQGDTAAAVKQPSFDPKAFYNDFKAHQDASAADSLKLGTGAPGQDLVPGVKVGTDGSLTFNHGGADPIIQASLSGKGPPDKLTLASTVDQDKPRIPEQRAIGADGKPLPGLIKDPVSRVEGEPAPAPQFRSLGPRRDGAPVDAALPARKDGAPVDAALPARKDGAPVDAALPARKDGAPVDAALPARKDGAPVDAALPARKDGAPVDAALPARKDGAPVDAALPARKDGAPVDAALPARKDGAPVDAALPARKDGAPVDAALPARKDGAPVDAALPARKDGAPVDAALPARKDGAPVDAALPARKDGAPVDAAPPAEEITIGRKEGPFQALDRWNKTQPPDKQLSVKQLQEEARAMRDEAFAQPGHPKWMKEGEKLKINQERINERLGIKPETKVAPAETAKPEDGTHVKVPLDGGGTQDTLTRPDGTRQTTVEKGNEKMVTQYPPKTDDPKSQIPKSYEYTKKRDDGSIDETKSKAENGDLTATRYDAQSKPIEQLVKHPDGSTQHTEWNGNVKTTAEYAPGAKDKNDFKSIKREISRPNGTLESSQTVESNGDTTATSYDDKGNPKHQELTRKDNSGQVTDWDSTGAKSVQEVDQTRQPVGKPVKYDNTGTKIADTTASPASDTPVQMDPELKKNFDRLVNETAAALKQTDFDTTGKLDPKIADQITGALHGLSDKGYSAKILQDALNAKLAEDKSGYRFVLASDKANQNYVGGVTTADGKPLTGSGFFQTKEQAQKPSDFIGGVGDDQGINKGMPNPDALKTKLQSA